MEQITDYYRYIKLMRNGFYDKLFFVDKLFSPWETLADFGCADGFQTKILAEIFPEKRVIGYDSDEEMINKARFTGSLPGNVSFTTKSDDSRLLNAHVIFASSVIHEVYAYSKFPEQIENFWKLMYSRNRKYVIIRDMAYTDVLGQTVTGMKDHENASKVRKWCIDNQCLGELSRFEEIFGHITEVKNLMHFLLKYPYITSPNWMREVHENYLPLSVEQIIKLAPEGWRLDYQEHSILPFFKDKWREELDVEIPYKTHIKLIFRNHLYEK